jgi:hypothetical protein
MIFWPPRCVSCVRKAALRPMFLDHDIAILGAALGVELATPAADFERPQRLVLLLKHVDVLPVVVVTAVRIRAVMRNDKDPDLSARPGSAFAGWRTCRMRQRSP